MNNEQKDLISLFSVLPRGRHLSTTTGFKDL